MAVITRAIAASLILLVLVTAACPMPADRTGADTTGDTTAAADAETLLRTSALEYQVDTTGGEVALSIAVTVANETADSLFLATCGANRPAWVMERLDDGEYTVALRPACPMIATGPLVVAPGASRTDTLSIRAGMPRAGQPAVSAPTFEADSVGGTYRIVYEIFERGWEAATAPDPAARLSLDARSSNRFMLRP